MNSSGPKNNGIEMQAKIQFNTITLYLFIFYKREFINFNWKNQIDLNSEPFFIKLSLRFIDKFFIPKIYP